MVMKAGGHRGARGDAGREQEGGLREEIERERWEEQNGGREKEGWGRLWSGKGKSRGWGKREWEENNQKGTGNMICLRLPHVKLRHHHLFLSCHLFLVLTAVHSLPSFYPEVCLALRLVMCLITLCSTVHCELISLFTFCHLFIPLVAPDILQPICLLSLWFHSAVLSSCFPWIPVFFSLKVFFFFAFSPVSLL